MLITLRSGRGKDLSLLLLVVFSLFFITACQDKSTGGPGAQTIQQGAGSSTPIDQKAERARTVDGYFQSVVEEVRNIDVQIVGGGGANTHPRRLRQPYPTREQVEGTLGPPDETNTTEGTVTWGSWMAKFSKGDGRLTDLTHYLPATPTFASGWEGIERDAWRWSLNRVGGA